MFLHFGIRDFGIVIRMVREANIIESINRMELVKRFQDQALIFSLYRSYDFLGERGGFFNLTQVKSLDCIPYWKIYNQEELPDLKKNLKEASKTFFNEYMKAIEQEIAGLDIPEYTTAEINNVNDEIEIKMKATKELVMKFSNLEIKDEANLKTTVQSALFKEFETSKEKIIDTNIVKDTVLDAINSLNFKSSHSKEGSDCPSDEEVFEDANGVTIDEAENMIRERITEKISELESNLTDDFITEGLSIDVETTNVGSEVTSDCSEQPDNETCTTFCNFDYLGFADVLITVKNENKQFLIENELKPISFKFRVIDGNLEVEPNTNTCD